MNHLPIPVGEFDASHGRQFLHRRPQLRLLRLINGGGGTPGRLLENQGGRPALAKGGGPSSNGVRIPSQGLRRTRSCPALGQQSDGVPSLPLPGRRRQNKPPVQIPGIHLPLFEKPVNLSHTHHQPLPNPISGNPATPQIYRITLRISPWLWFSLKRVATSPLSLWDRYRVRGFPSNFAGAIKARFRQPNTVGSPPHLKQQSSKTTIRP